MDKLRSMAVFVAIAEQGSLTNAANTLGKSLPTVVRVLSVLEDYLKVRLFNRTTRKIALTEEGHIYLRHCKKTLAEIEEAEQLLINEQPEPSGTVTLTAPVRFGEMYVSPLITQFLKQYPQMRVNLLLHDRVINLLDEGVDLAIRIAPTKDSSMIAKPIGKIRQIVCASPELIEQYGIPQRPEALSEMPCIQFTGLASANKWMFAENGKPFSVITQGPLSCNQVASSVESCLSGLGFGLFLCYQVMPWVKRGELKIVLADFEPSAESVNIIFHHSRLMATRVRRLVEFLARELKIALK